MEVILCSHQLKKKEFPFFTTSVPLTLEEEQRRIGNRGKHTDAPSIGRLRGGGTSVPHLSRGTTSVIPLGGYSILTNRKEVNNMRLIECEKCYRGFLPNDEEILPIISGRSVAKREESKGVVCPHCGHKQSKESLVTPV
jgi:hypothetical protein